MVLYDGRITRSRSGALSLDTCWCSRVSSLYLWLSLLFEGVAHATAGAGHSERGTRALVAAGLDRTWRWPDDLVVGLASSPLLAGAGDHRGRRRLRPLLRARQRHAAIGGGRAP